MCKALVEKDSLEFTDIKEAEERIAPYVRRTPLLRSTFLSRVAQGEIYLKLENLQELSSFKIRGMVNKVLTLDDRAREKGVVVVSSGNHAIAASYCGRLWHMPVEVYVPRVTPRTKVEKIKAFGARVHIVGDSYDECARIMREERGELPDRTRVYVDSSSDPAVVAGYGTIGTEILEQHPALDQVVVPVGGGGLITGIGLAVKTLSPQVKVLGIQTEACPAMVASLRDGRAYEEYPSDPSICEALAGGIGLLPFAYAPRCIDAVCVTSEESIKEALGCLLLQDKVLAEPSGAIAAAYVLENPRKFRGKNTVLVISGGNISFEILLDQIRALAGEQNEQ